MRFLVVEDEATLSRQLAHAVGEAGYAVDCAADGEQADFLVRTETYDAIILDLGLPRVDGLTLLRGWRDAALMVPVLVLTARGSWHERVKGIDDGADDYVTKPFQMEEVLARLRACDDRWITTPISPPVEGDGRRISASPGRLARRSHRPPPVCAAAPASGTGAGLLQRS